MPAFIPGLELGAMFFREAVKPLLDRAFPALRYSAALIWLYLLASAWSRIGQEEHLMGRAGSVADEIGSAIIASRRLFD